MGAITPSSAFGSGACFRNEEHPTQFTEVEDDNVFALKADSLVSLSFEKVSSSYDAVYNDEDIRLLADAWGTYKSSEIWDEGAIRLESVSGDGKIKISKISFYDLIATNILRSEFLDFKKWLINAYGNDYPLVALLDELRDVFLDIRPESFYDILKTGLSNAVAISVLLYTPASELLLIKRSKNVAIGQSLLGVSVTGSMNHKDFEQPNPVVAATLRETREELGIELDPHSIRVTGIAAGKRKLQPAFLVTATVPGSFDNLLAIRPTCDEICSTLQIGRNLFDSSNESLTEIAKYQLLSDPRIMK